MILDPNVKEFTTYFLTNTATTTPTMIITTDPETTEIQILFVLWSRKIFLSKSFTERKIQILKK